MKYDIITVGAGPAGLTAALYAVRAGKTALILEKGAFGGQITFSPKVENIPGTEEISGNDFAAALVEQVMNQGAELEPAEVLSVKIEPDGSKRVICDCGEYFSDAVIIASGARHRLLGLENEEALIGSGISFCAVCDGAFYKGRTVGVVGGGNSALQEAALLADVADKVVIIQNLEYLTGEKTLQDRILSKPNVRIMTGCTVQKIVGEKKLEGVSVMNGKTEETEYIPLDGLFIAIGLIPQNGIFKDIIALDGFGYADSGEDCLTKTPGIFVAGDCRKKSVRQVATACSDGAAAAIAACSYVDSLRAV